MKEELGKNETDDIIIQDMSNNGNNLSNFRKDNDRAVENNDQLNGLYNNANKIIENILTEKVSIFECIFEKTKTIYVEMLKKHLNDTLKIDMMSQALNELNNDKFNENDFDKIKENIQNLEKQYINTERNKEKAELITNRFIDILLDNDRIKNIENNYNGVSLVDGDDDSLIHNLENLNTILGENGNINETNEIDNKFKEEFKVITEKENKKVEEINLKLMNNVNNESSMKQSSTILNLNNTQNKNNAQDDMSNFFNVKYPEKINKNNKYEQSDISTNFHRFGDMNFNAYNNNMGYNQDQDTNNTRININMNMNQSKQSYNPNFNGNAILLFHIPKFVGREDEIANAIQDIFPEAGVINIEIDRKKINKFVARIYIDCDILEEVYNSFEPTSIYINEYELNIEKNNHTKFLSLNVNGFNKQRNNY